MSYHDEAPSGESDAEVTHRLGAFAMKLHELVDAEKHTSGCGGTLVGFGLGLMMAEGADPAELRAACENVIQGLIEGSELLRERERKTLS
jgi:hypothetical protein